MSGVVGRDHRSRSVAGDEGPVVAGLEVVVVLAERVELVDARALGLDPFVAVVVLEPPGPRTAQHGAGRRAAVGSARRSVMRPRTARCNRPAG